jgi:hypothetical protein
MDASELELDAKLYKASGTLLKELQAKLPLLLFHPGSVPRRVRSRVLHTKYSELVYNASLLQLMSSTKV